MTARTRHTLMGAAGTVLAILLITAAWAQDADERQGFAEELAERHGFDPSRISETLAGAERRQDILDAISRPAEAKPWYEYRPIFLTPSRIEGGIEFWNRHEDLISRASEEYDVDPAVIVAIIGVETRYGEHTGSYRVLDALATLAFHYPPRSSFFRRELESLFLLGRDEPLSLTEIKGSYAGAMGLGQFIPSSYRAYAVDFDGDGGRDLWQPADAIGSVANYFRQHGWRQGEPVASRAEVAPNAKPIPDAPIKPEWTLSELEERGFRPSEPVDPGLEATLIALEQPNEKEFWLGFHNFYVISRYNRSALYSMAVLQLSRAIEEARDYQTGLITR